MIFVNYWKLFIKELKLFFKYRKVFNKFMTIVNECGKENAGNAKDIALLFAFAFNEIE